MLSEVRDFMTLKVEALAPDATMEEAVLLAMRRKIRHIPIVEAGKLVGILTDRDIKKAMPSLLTGVDQEEYRRILSATRVSQIMTRSPTTTTPDAPLREVVRTLCDKKFGALPVVEGGRVVGIITETDLLRAFLKVLERET